MGSTARSCASGLRRSGHGEAQVWGSAGTLVGSSGVRNQVLLGPAFGHPVADHVRSVNTLPTVRLHGKAGALSLTANDWMS